MARQTVSPKSSGGSGYSFETRVGAWYALHLLAGRSPLDPTLGPPKQVKLQCRVDGVVLDDVVIEFAKVRAFVSVKSGPEITGPRLPADFVGDCFEQVLSDDLAPCDPSRDRLVLATSPIPAAARRAIDEATQRANAHEPADFDRRVNEPGWANQDVRDLVASVSDPQPSRAGHPIFGNSPGWFLKGVRVREFDFGPPDSRAEVDALSTCQAMVVRADDAALLWDRVCAIIDAERGAGLSLTLSTLLDRLRPQIRLRNYPPDGTAWEYLERVTARWASELRDTIGATTRLDRAAYRMKVLEALEEGVAAVLVGESGAGKSCIAKDVLEALPDDCIAVALGAGDVAESVRDVGGFVTPEGLTDVLDRITTRRGLLLFDGLDRGGTSELSAARRLLKGMRLNPDSPWRILVTCSEERWADLSREMFGADVLPDATLLSIPLLKRAEVERVADAHPALTNLLSRRDISPITSKPGILDLLARNAEALGRQDTSGWAGESDLVDWLWNFIFPATTHARERRLLQRVAVSLADAGAVAVALSDLEDTETELISPLERRGWLHRREDTIRFRHDLLADYVRQRWLLSEVVAGRTQSAVSRCRTPFWHRSIRLLSLDLLERQGRSSESIQTWLTLLRELELSDQTALVGVDLLVEAIAIAADPGTPLERVTDQLLREGRPLLGRFLSRFVLAASVPRRDISSKAIPSIQLDLEAKFRRPDSRRWAPVLRWLATHRSDALLRAPAETSDIAWRWLLSARWCAPYGTLPLVDEASAIVCELVSRSLGFRKQGPLRREARREMIKALLLAAFHIPESAIPLIRIAAGRERVEDPDRDEVDAAIAASPLGPWIKSQTSREPWPRGPKQLPDDDLQSVALDPFGASLLVDLDPDLAEEVFFSLLITMPRLDCLPGDCQLNNHGAAYPPFHDFAPVRCLLEVDPEQGIMFVRQLVEFATDRWLEERAPGAGSEPQEPPAVNAQPIHLLVAGEWRPYRGGRDVHDWHTGGSVGPAAGAAALMALEEWLYERLDTDPTAIEARLWSLLLESDSTAILGVLVDVCLKNPVLLGGPLEPLATSAELLRWNRDRNVDSELWAAMMGWTGEHHERRNAAHEWHSQQHRRADLVSAVIRVWGQKDFQWEVLSAARDRWKEARQETSDSVLAEWLDLLCAQVDESNWKPTAADSDGPGFRFVPPDGLTEKLDSTRAGVDEGMFRLTFPMQMQAVLEGKATLDRSRLPGLFDRARDAAEGTDDLTEEELWNLRCGAAAVALCCHLDWLEEDGERLALARSWVIEVWRVLPASSRGIIPESAGPFAWDTFCGYALPVLLARDTRDEEIRWAVAQCLAAPHYSTVTALVRGGLERLAPDDLGTLLHLLAVASRACWIVRMLRQSQEDQRAIWSRTERAAAAIVDEFRQGRLPPLPERWWESTGRWPPGVARIWGYTDETWRWASELQRLVAAIVPLKANSTRLGDVYLARFVSGLGALVTGDLEARSTNGRAFDAADRMPHETEREIARSCAALLFHTQSAEARAELCDSWLRLSLDCHYWTEEFLDAVYEHGLTASESPVRFATVMPDVLSATLSDDRAWMTPGSPRGADGIASALLGCQWHRVWSQRWTDLSEPVLRVVHQAWSDWCGFGLRFQRPATVFLELLATDAARGVRREALVWLVAHDTQRFTRDSSFRTSLIDLLDTMDQEGFPGVAEEQRTAFHTLLAACVDTGDKRAVLLSGRIADRR